HARVCTLADVRRRGRTGADQTALRIHSSRTATLAPGFFQAPEIGRARFAVSMRRSQECGFQHLSILPIRELVRGIGRKDFSDLFFRTRLAASKHDYAKTKEA